MRKKSQPKGPGPAETVAALGPPGYNVFLMWSGEMSRHLANVLHSWLPRVHQSVKPWMSSHDIERGAVWESELLGQLATQRIGIACLTPEVPSGSYWMLFEAGAIWKSGDDANRICTYLLDISSNDVGQPLNKFQWTTATKESTLGLLQTINNAIGAPLDASAVEESFGVWWERLETALKAIPRGTTPHPAPRPVSVMVEEILTATRNQDRTLETLVSWATSTEALLQDILGLTTYTRNSMVHRFDTLRLSEIQGRSLGLKDFAQSRSEPKPLTARERLSLDRTRAQQMAARRAAAAAEEAAAVKQAKEADASLRPPKNDE